LQTLAVNRCAHDVKSRTTISKKSAVSENYRHPTYHKEMTETIASRQSDAARASTPNNASAGTTAEATRALLACGVVAGPLFLGVAILEALTRPGFDPGRHPISLLSLGDFGWIQIANFIASGLLSLAFAVGMRRVLRGDQGGTWGPVLIGAFGVGLLVAGVFVPDPAWSFPPGAPAGIPSQLSWHSTLHGVGFTLAFGAVCLACLVFARRWMSLGQRALAVYAAVTALVAVALSGWPGTDGAAVRYFAAAVIVWTWTVVLALRLRSELRSGHRA
jgi:hypothetical membrane protein